MRRWPRSLLPPTHPVTRYRSRKYSALAQKVEQTRTRTESIPIALPPDPYTIVAPELAQLRASLLNLLGSAHPGLSDIAQCCFLHPSQQLRPLLVLLFSRATNGLGGNWGQKRWAAECESATGLSEELDQPLNLPGVLNDWHPNMPDGSSSFKTVFHLRTTKLHDRVPLPPPIYENGGFLASPPRLLPTQMRLAQIVEMIHVASLLHDDVFDDAAPPSDVASVPGRFGNKLSILGGDFLLGRASTALSRLGESEVVELVASVISNLVEGQMLKMTEVRTPKLGLVSGPKTSEEAWQTYLKKTYLMTASLMAKGARAAVVLGGCSEAEVWKEVAYGYGRNLGIAFQLVNDIRDYEAGSTSLQPGLATGPALYAWEEHPDLGMLIQRNFANEGDTELAIDYVRRSSGIDRTQVLAQAYACKAKEILHVLPDSDTKTALSVLTDMVVNRTW